MVSTSAKMIGHLGLGVDVHGVRMCLTSLTSSSWRTSTPDSLLISMLIGGAFLGVLWGVGVGVIPVVVGADYGPHQAVPDHVLGIQDGKVDVVDARQDFLHHTQPRTWFPWAGQSG